MDISQSANQPTKPPVETPGQTGQQPPTTTSPIAEAPEPTTPQPEKVSATTAPEPTPYQPLTPKPTPMPAPTPPPAEQPTQQTTPLSSQKPTEGKKKILLSFIVLILLIGVAFLAYKIVKPKLPGKTPETTPSEACPDPCLSNISQSTKEGCENYCLARTVKNWIDGDPDHSDATGPYICNLPDNCCYPYTVRGEQCEEATCWYCKQANPPTPLPSTTCPNPAFSQQTKEGCEIWCSCESGEDPYGNWIQAGDLTNSKYDTCQQASDGCWWCEERPAPLRDCCPCWHECTEDDVCPPNLRCLSVSGTKRCVNPNCPNQQNCTCPSAGPSPSPSPSPSESPRVSASPSASPESEITCVNLTRKPKAELEIGDTVSFTCVALVSNNNDSDVYFDYRIHIPNNTEYWVYPKSWQEITGATPKFRIEYAGDYIVECRVCTTEDNCTAWGKPSG